MSCQTNNTDLQEMTNSIMIFILQGWIFSQCDWFDKYRWFLTCGMWIKKPEAHPAKTQDQVILLWLLSVSHNSSLQWVKEVVLTAFRQQVCFWAHRCCCLQHARVHFWFDSGGNNYRPSLSHCLLRVLQAPCTICNINSVFQSVSCFSDLVALVLTCRVVARTKCQGSKPISVTIS